MSDESPEEKEPRKSKRQRLSETGGKLLRGSVRGGKIVLRGGRAAVRGVHAVKESGEKAVKSKRFQTIIGKPSPKTKKPKATTRKKPKATTRKKSTSPTRYQFIAPNGTVITKREADRLKGLGVKVRRRAITKTPIHKNKNRVTQRQLDRG